MAVAGGKSRLAVAALLCWQRASQIDERAVVRRATAGKRAKQRAAGLSRGGEYRHGWEP